MRRRVTKDETLEQKIVKAQEKVARTAAAHERAVDALQILLDSGMPSEKKKYGKQSSIAAKAMKRSLR